MQGPGLPFLPSCWCQSPSSKLLEICFCQGPSPTCIWNFIPLYSGIPSQINLSSVPSSMFSQCSLLLLSILGVLWAQDIQHTLILSQSSLHLPTSWSLWSLSGIYQWTLLLRVGKPFLQKWGLVGNFCFLDLKSVRIPLCLSSAFPPKLLFLCSFLYYIWVDLACSFSEAHRNSLSATFVIDVIFYS